MEDGLQFPILGKLWLCNVQYVNINHLFHEVPLVTPEQAVGMHYFNQRYNMKTTAGIFRMKSRWEGFTKYKETVHVDTLFLF